MEILALAPLAFGGPLARSAEDVHLYWTHKKGIARQSLTLADANKTRVFGRSCDEKLDTGDFADFPMSFAVDDNGFGKVNVNGKTYKVHSKPEYSGGIACSKAYGLDLAEIDCIIPWTGDFDLSEIPANETRSCFDNERLAVEANFLTVSKRQGGGNGGCLPGAATGLVDDGDPHQNYFHKQITQNIQCRDSPSCSVGHEQITSYSYSWTVDVDVVEWTTGGFSVTQEYSNGNQYTCYGDPGDTVCVWYKMAYTAYTVVDGDYYPCSGGFTSGNSAHAIMKSPNKDNKGGNYYCVIGSCRSTSQGYWGDEQRVGGP